MRCRILETSENVLDMPWNFWNVVLGKGGEDQLDRSCEKWSTTLSQGGKEFRTWNKRKEGRKEGRKPNWIRHILRRNCLLKDVIKGKVEGRKEVTGRRGRRCKELLNDIHKKKIYWKLKENVLYCVLWRTRYGPVPREVRRNGEDDKDDDVRWWRKESSACRKMVQRGRKC